MKIRSLSIAILIAGVLVTSASASLPITSTQVNYSGVVYDATVGPDGNTWFTDFVNDTIGRLDSNGNVTTFPLAKGTHPMYIASGADGNLWFSAGNNRIGRISTAGFFADFPAVGFPGKIARGPDGAVWYLDRVNYRLSRVAPDGTIAQFNIGNDSLVDLIAGPDANLWIADYTASSVLKFSPSTRQVIAKYPAGPQGYAGDRLVVGPDGNIWFTHGDAIVRMKLDGTVTSFPASPNSFPFSLTVGGDGNLWFGEYSSQRLGQLVIPKGGGQPTITESDPLGNGPGLIISIPAKPQRAGKTALPLDDGCGQPCPSPTFIVAYDKGTVNPGSNMAKVSAPPSATCADISSEFSVLQGLDGSAFIAITVTNGGPTIASGVTAHFQMSSPPGTLSLKDIGPFDARAADQLTLTSTSDGADFSASSLPCGAQIFEELEIAGSMAKSDSASGTVTAFSSTPDPVPMNNAFEMSWSFANVERHVLPTPPPDVIIGVGQRGK